MIILQQHEPRGASYHLIQNYTYGSGVTKAVVPPNVGRSMMWQHAHGATSKLTCPETGHPAECGVG